MAANKCTSDEFALVENAIALVDCRLGGLRFALESQPKALRAETLGLIDNALDRRAILMHLRDGIGESDK